MARQRGAALNLRVTVAKEADVRRAGRCAQSDATYVMADNMGFTLDGMPVVAAAPAGTFGPDADGAAWNWQDIGFDRRSLAAGSHVFAIVKTGVAVDIDCLSLVVTAMEADFAAYGPGTYAVEGEDVDRTDLLFDAAGPDGAVESDPRDSNGQSLGHVIGGYFEIAFYVDAATGVGITPILSKYEPLAVASLFTLSLDGNDLPFVGPDQTLGRAEDGSNDYFNWKECPAVASRLEPGLHVLRVSLTGGNVDVIRFALTDYAA